jgi:hypothetical protein
MMGKRLLGTLLFACILLGVHSAAALADVTSVSISAPNATQGVPTSVTVSGTVSTGYGLPQKLYVYVGADTGCGPTPEYVDGTVLANGTGLGSGGFSQTYSYTPASANTTYEICAYIDDSYYDTPAAQTDATFSTSLPAASVSISAPDAT